MNEMVIKYLIDAHYDPYQNNFLNVFFTIKKKLISPPDYRKLGFCKYIDISPIVIFLYYLRQKILNFLSDIFVKNIFFLLHRALGIRIVAKPRNKSGTFSLRS